MRIKVDNPADVPALISVLSERVDTVVSRAAIDEVEVSLLGSRSAEGDAAELTRRLQDVPIKVRLIRNR